MTISRWTGDQMTDERISEAIDRYLPTLKSAGVLSFRVVRIGENQCCAIAEYPDEDAATRVQEKVSDLRAQTSYEFSWKMVGLEHGNVII